MGLIKNVKTEQMRQEAAKARAEGRRTMAVKLNFPATKPDLSGEVVDWSLMIDAIESQGWMLCHWTGAADSKGRPEVLAVFRLRQ